MQFLSVSDVAREIGCRPRDISDAFYGRHLDDTICPIVGRRRLIPRSYVPVVRDVIEHRGAPQREAATTR